MKPLMIATALLALVAGPVYAADGKAVYNTACKACHDSGVAGAPKMGDKAAWASRIKAGEKAMIASVTKGKGAMPPKGGNASLTDADIKAVVKYMLSANK